MISVIDTAAGKANATIYQLQVVLLGSKPPVWRRMRKILMGRDDYHE